MRAETAVTTTKRMGMIQSSFNLDGEREKATLEKRRHGVKSETLTRLSCFWVFLSSIPLLASTLRTERHGYKAQATAFIDFVAANIRDTI
jgi:hypothetical protein